MRNHIKGISILLCFFMCIILSGCSNNTPSAPKPTSLPQPSDYVALSKTMELFSKMNDRTTPLDIEILTKDTDFYTRIGGDNSSKEYYIALDPRIIQQYDAIDGDRIIISYPRKNHSKDFYVFPDKVIFECHGKRHWCIAQLYSVYSGYNPSYWDIKGAGIWVRQWPTIEGNKEVTRFRSLSDAIQFVAYYRNQ